MFELTKDTDILPSQVSFVYFKDSWIYHENIVHND